MAYTGKKPIDHTDVTQSQSMTVTDDLTVDGAITSQNGVYLGGTGSANQLDDYEEGTWTPTPSAGTISHNSYYTKIGRLVTVHANIHTFSNRTSSNNLSFTGLPFQVAGNSWASQGIMARFINAGGDSIVAYAQSNSTSLKIYSVVNNANYVHVRHNHLSSNSTNLFVTVSYLTD